jgi:hypothetical protein
MALIAVIGCCGDSGFDGKFLAKKPGWLGVLDSGG